MPAVASSPCLPESSPLEASTGSTSRPFADAYVAMWPVAVASARGIVRDSAIAEDVAQDVFLELWSEPTKFDPQRGSLSTYVKVLARSRALDRVRSDIARRRTVDRFAGTYGAAEMVAPPADCTIASEARALAAAIRQLPEGQPQAVLLAYGRGLTAREIAEHEGVPVGTAKSRVRLGVDKLRQAVGDRRSPLHGAALRDD